MPEYAKPLGDTIREARIRHGYTQRGLAEQLAMDSRTILNIENYNGNPKMTILYPLVRKLEIDPWDIFYPELKQEESAFREMQILLKECSDDEIAALIPVVEAALNIIKTTRGKKV